MQTADAFRFSGSLLPLLTLSEDDAVGDVIRSLRRMSALEAASSDTALPVEESLWTLPIFRQWPLSFQAFLRSANRVGRKLSFSSYSIKVQHPYSFLDFLLNLAPTMPPIPPTSRKAITVCSNQPEPLPSLSISANGFSPRYLPSAISSRARWCWIHRVCCRFLLW